jgi:hypothetical protein
MQAYRLQAYPWSDQPEYASAENISNLKWTGESVSLHHASGQLLPQEMAVIIRNPDLPVAGMS